MQLPEKLGDVFKALSRGRHITIEDGELWQHLNDSTDAYTEIFRALGFEMISDAHGYFYFNGSDKTLNDGTQKIAIFIYIMSDWIADNKDTLIDAFFENEFRVADLPHLTHDRYRGYMERVAINDTSDLQKTIGKMSRLGFIRITREEPQSFRFMPPIWRIIDFCMQNELGPEDEIIGQQVTTGEDDDTRG